MYTMFHERIKKLRMEANISREHLAKALDISYAALAKYETGKREPDFVTLIKMADYFTVTTDFLLGRENALNANANMEELVKNKTLELLEKTLNSLKEENKQN